MQTMNERGDMGCDPFADVAAELALGVLTGRERADALAHLDRCPACRETVRQLTMTGEQLLELLPPVEPPAGFESRVLARLGIAVPDVPPAPAPSAVVVTRQAPAFGGTETGTATGGTGTGTGRLLGRRRRTRRAVKASPPGHAGTRPGPGRGPGRRTLATLATAMVVAVAALGGWGLHSVTSPAAQSPLHSVALLSATHQDVGQIYYYDSSSKQWVYMAVNMPSGDGTVICELEGPGGQYSKVGTFKLAGGYGAWGSPGWQNNGKLMGARLLAPSGKVLATATFS
jgi:hypothetical protein